MLSSGDNSINTLFSKQGRYYAVLLIKNVCYIMITLLITNFLIALKIRCNTGKLKIYLTIKKTVNAILVQSKGF